MTEYKFDPSLNILYRKDHELDALFIPKNIAVIGATDRDNSVGRTLLWNLLQSPFKGTIYPVNPKRDSILGIKTYKSVLEIPSAIDLAIIVTPAATVPNVIRECKEANVPAAVIISAGFKEQGVEGKKLELKILEEKGKMRIIGPNCLGVMNPHIGLNATFASHMALKGNVAFISQSGALCTAVLDWSLREKIGFSFFISIGSMADVNFGDLISYLGNDPNTKSILIYMESIGNPRAFLSAARQVALTKPIILIKAGTTDESAQAAASHTGSLAGNDLILSAALKRAGVLRVETISDLFNMAEIFSKQPLPKGPNLTIITNAGGPGVIATDALIKHGGQLTKLSSETMEKLNKTLPKEWSHNNPVDLLGDAPPDLYQSAVEIIHQDENTDGILIILTPQYMTDPTKTAEKIQFISKLSKKPVLASWMGAKSVEEGIQILTEANIPCFSHPDEACKAFAYMWAYSKKLEILYETPLPSYESLDTQKVESRQASLHQIFSLAHQTNRTLLDETESKRILELYDIPSVPTYIAENKKEAVQLAKQLNFPIVLKLSSQTITHKTDVGGVKINLSNEKEVEKAFEEIQNAVPPKDFQGVSVQPMVPLREGFELILGSMVDKEFGPVILFGSGGEMVEIIKDRSIALPPLTSTLARKLIFETKIGKALQGYRGKKGIDLGALENILIRFGQLITENLQIKECDINPLFVSHKQIYALDARIILNEDPSPIPAAIRPYPLRYVHNAKIKDGTEIIFRPIRPEDVPLIIRFLHEVSERSLYHRYLKVLDYDELTQKERLIRMCFNDYDREIALVAEKVLNGKEREILGVGRLVNILGTAEASFALIVKNKYQNKGIGTKILELLIQIGKNENVKKIVAKMLPDNHEMVHICKQHGFTLEPDQDMGMTFASLSLQKES
ncbi:MAG: GNAT family N-acetyltransferase [Chlamydiota bacterium]